MSITPIKPSVRHWTAAKAHGIPADHVRDVFANGTPKQVRKLHKKLGLPVPPQYAKHADPVVTANVARTNANAPTPRSRITPRTAAAAKVTKPKPTAADISTAREARLAEYADTLLVVPGTDGKVTLLHLPTYDRIVSVNGTGRASKSVAVRDMLAVVEYTAQVAAGTAPKPKTDPERAFASLVSETVLA